jgi:hypothetical protein
MRFAASIAVVLAFGLVSSVASADPPKGDAPQTSRSARPKPPKKKPGRDDAAGAAGAPSAAGEMASEVDARARPSSGTPAAASTDTVAPSREETDRRRTTSSAATLAPKDSARDGSKSSAGATSGEGGDAQAQDRSEKSDGKRVFRFGELEIEGRLKSPQLVYFLRRVRAEFAAADLGHRTFFPELSQTRKEPHF